MQPDLLKQLRDIHYPPPIPVWPLAMGWYILFGLLIVVAILVAYLWIQQIKKQLLKKIVLKRLDELEEQQHVQQDVAEELSMLLRRAALAKYPRHVVAGLYGEEWLNFLNKTAMTTEFTEGVGKLLIVSPYRGKAQALPESLFHLIKNWVKKNL